MSTKSLYEEAIADARKIKEVAEENAKKAILETVTPRIREFIEQQLLEQNDEMSEADETMEAEEVEEEVTLDESAIASLLGLLNDNFDESFLSEGKSQSELASSLKSAIQNLTESERKKLFEVANNKSSEQTEHASINNNQAKGDSDMSNDKYYEVDLQMLREAVEDQKEAKHDDMEEGYDMTEMEMKELYDMLNEQEEEEEAEVEMEAEAPESDDMISKEELRKELEDLMKDLGLEEEGAMEAPEAEEEEAPEPAAEEEEEVDFAAMFGGEEEAAEEEEAEAESLEEVFEIDPQMLKQELARVRKQLQEGKGIAKDMEHHFGGKGKANAGTKGAFGGGKEGQDAFTNPPKTLLEMRRQLRQQSLKNRALTEKLEKYVSAVNTLREQLEDLNLFNAKLLYVNKLLQNKALNESQKKSIIKALDKAENLQEAKTLYKSLTETFSTRKGKTLNESRNVGGSSRPTSSASANKAIAEVSRWTKLAGLEK
jgi:hypothetical protein